MCIYMYMDIHTCIHIHIHTHMDICISIYLHICMYSIYIIIYIYTIDIRDSMNTWISVENITSQIHSQLRSSSGLGVLPWSKECIPLYTIYENIWKTWFPLKSFQISTMNGLMTIHTICQLGPAERSLWDQSRCLIGVASQIQPPQLSWQESMLCGNTQWPVRHVDPAHKMCCMHFL